MKSKMNCSYVLAIVFLMICNSLFSQIENSDKRSAKVFKIWGWTSDNPQLKIDHKNGYLYTLKGNSIIVWNGKDWFELGGDNQSTFKGNILQIETDDLGNLYVVVFEFGNSVNNNIIYKWNGSSWSKMGIGFTEYSSLRFDKDLNIYVKARDQGKNGHPFVYYKWESDKWKEMKGALFQDNRMFTLSTNSKGNLEFTSLCSNEYEITSTHSAGVNANAERIRMQHVFIGKWNGKQWDEIGDKNNRDLDYSPDNNHFVAPIYIDNQNNIYIADGEIKKERDGYNSEYIYYYKIKKWDGSKWIEVSNKICNFQYNLDNITSDSKGKIYCTNLNKTNNRNQIIKIEDSKTVECSLLGLTQAIKNMIIDEKGYLFYIDDHSHIFKLEN